MYAQFPLPSLIYILLNNFVFNWLILEIHAVIPSILHNTDKCKKKKDQYYNVWILKGYFWSSFFTRSNENLNDYIIRAGSIGV